MLLRGGVLLSVQILNMHLVGFDIDGTLTNTNLVDGECYWRAVCEVLGLSGEQPEWSDFRHVTDVGIASELCKRHLSRQLNSADIEALGRRLATLLDSALGHKDPTAYQIPGSGEVLSILVTRPSSQWRWRQAVCDCRRSSSFAGPIC